MHTCCPHCQTTFVVTAGQFAVRQGLVRCGQCGMVFDGRSHLVDAHPPDGAASGGAGEAAPGQPLRPWIPPLAADGKTKGLAPRGQPSSLARRLLLTFWIVATVALAGLLAAQGVYFFATPLTRAFPEGREAVLEACYWLGCRVASSDDLADADLIESEVTPHPTYKAALRVRAVLINRGDDVRPWPRLELTLTDASGKALARRLVPPAEYLSDSIAPRAAMPTQLSIPVTFDVTAPRDHAAGYELRLLPVE